MFYRLFKIFKSWKPDLIHSWGTMSSIFAIPSAQFLNIKLINANIVNAPKNMGFFDKRLFRAKLTFPFSEIILGNSYAGLKAYNVPKSKRVCIYNGFGDNRISNLLNEDLVKEQFGVETVHVIGMVASFTDKKDFETFIEAAKIILSMRKDVTFLAVGNGPNLEKCRKMITSEINSYFKFTGVQTEIESIINIFDIGVLATNTKLHGEGISNSILEYMALGKATVATFGGGTNEIVENEKTGFLIASEAIDELVEKLNYLLNNLSEAKKMGVNGRKRIEEEFTLEQMTRSYYKLYQQVLNGKDKSSDLKTG